MDDILITLEILQDSVMSDDFFTKNEEKNVKEYLIV